MMGDGNTHVLGSRQYRTTAAAAAPERTGSAGRHDRVRHDPADDVTSGLREGGDGDSVAFPSAVLLFAGRETSTLCRPRYRAPARQPVPAPGDAFRHLVTRRPIVAAAPAISVT